MYIIKNRQFIKDSVELLRFLVPKYIRNHELKKRWDNHSVVIGQLFNLRNIIRIFGKNYSVSALSTLFLTVSGNTCRV